MDCRTYSRSDARVKPTRHFFARAGVRLRAGKDSGMERLPNVLPNVDIKVRPI